MTKDLKLKTMIISLICRFFSSGFKIDLIKEKTSPSTKRADDLVLPNPVILYRKVPSTYIYIYILLSIYAHVQYINIIYIYIYTCISIFTLFTIYIYIIFLINWCRISSIKSLAQKTTRLFSH